MTVTKTLCAVVAVILCALIAAGVYLSARTVPERQYDPRAFWGQKDLIGVQPDATIKRMIRHAQIDFLLSPTRGGRAQLQFWRADKTDGVMYLLFKPSNWSNTAIVYAYTISERKPLWKAEVATDND